MTLRPDRNLRVLVAGAGVAGLSTAYFLRELGREAGREPEIRILETQARHGGATRTERSGGYICEWGPNGFLDNEPATLDLVHRLGLDGELVRADDASANRFIYHGGVMRKVPVKPPAFLTSDILPLTAKLRMALEPFIPAKRNGIDETVDAFGRRRLGKGFAELMLDPMVSGIFAGNTHELSLEAVFPKMVAMEREYGGLFKAMIAKKKEARRNGTTAGGPAGPNATLHTFRNGMGRLTDRLATEFERSLTTGHTVQSVKPDGEGGFVVHTDHGDEHADIVVLATPSWASSTIVENLDAGVAEALKGIYHAPVDVVCHGHRDEDLGQPLNGFGVLIPRSEGIRSLGSLWSNAIFPGQAPEGHTLLRTILGGAHDPGIQNLSEAELHATAASDHRRVMDVRRDPVYQTQFRHPRGIAQYTVGHLGRVAKSEKLEHDLPGLFFTGASYRGVSVNGCAKDALRIARKVFAGKEQ